MALNMEWYDWVGILGTLMVLGGFFLLQAGRVNGNGLAYQLLNLLGAAAILVSLLGSFNISVFLLELAWIFVSGYGIVRSFRLRRAATALPR
jgi:paired small multidrug resistance pump